MFVEKNLKKYSVHHRFLIRSSQRQTWENNFDALVIFFNKYN